MGRLKANLLRIRSCRTAPGTFVVLLLTFAAVVLPAVGCASLDSWTTGGWLADYDVAEARGRETGRPVLIVYTDDRPGVHDTTRKVLSAPGIKSRIARFVRCTLVKSYEPDRRYVAQFGVERAPALIVVHRDGTYHAKVGTMNPAETFQFLLDAKPPGARPRLNPHIPRRPRYAWHMSVEAARAEAARSGRPMLVVYERRFSRDWPRIESLLHKREVYSRFADMAHCRETVSSLFADACITPFGALKLPAIVVVARDGTHCTLELPTSSLAIARFADRCRRGEAVTSTPAPNVPVTGTASGAHSEGAGSASK